MIVAELILLLGIRIILFSTFRSIVWRSVISITVPTTSSSTLMKSPTLNGRVNIMNSPPTMFDKASCEARPTAMARIPALASMELLIFSIPGMSERKVAQPMIYIAVTTICFRNITFVTSIPFSACFRIVWRKRYFAIAVRILTIRYITTSLMPKMIASSTFMLKCASLRRCLRECSGTFSISLMEFKNKRLVICCCDHKCFLSFQVCKNFLHFFCLSICKCKSINYY